MTPEEAVHAAHAAGDGRWLARLYARAAGEATGDARAFLLTQAWVFALEAGDPAATGLEEALRGMDRA